MAGKQKTPGSAKERRQYTRPSGSKERRIYIRTKASVPLTFNIEAAGGTKAFEAVTKNVSATGLLVEADKKIPLNVEGRIDINTPDSSNPVHAMGKIVRCSAIEGSDKFDCGIEFTSIEEDNKNTFLKFLCDAIYKVSGE